MFILSQACHMQRLFRPSWHHNERNWSTNNPWSSSYAIFSIPPPTSSVLSPCIFPVPHSRTHLYSVFIPWHERSGFIPIKYRRQKLEICVFCYQIGIKNILRRIIRALSGLHSHLIFSWMQFWFVTLMTRYLNLLNSRRIHSLSL